MEDLKAALGQCFWIGINGMDVKEESTRDIFKEFEPGGVILFQRNVESIDQVQKLNQDLQKQSKVPLLIAVDQEGGVVERLHNIIGTIPPAMAFAASGSKLITRRLHQAHARILRLLGFNVNFTPVLDLALASSNNGLGTRCFSSNPRVVKEYGELVIDAHLRNGVMPCGKHFPGLGDTDRDSHLDLPSVSRAWRKILKQDLAPYRPLLHKLPFIMINHALYPDMDDQSVASLSQRIVQDFLFRRMRYEGLAVSDDLIMGAVSKFHDLAESAEKALLAGNHLFLICRPEGVVETYRALLKKAQSDGPLSKAILRGSTRVQSLKAARSRAIPKWNLDKEIDAMGTLSQQVSRKSVTLLYGNTIRGVPETCTVYLPRTKWVKEEDNALTQFLAAQRCKVQTLCYPLDLTREQAHQVAQQSPAADWTIVVLANSSQHSGQLSLLRQLVHDGKKVSVISGAYPEDAIPGTVQVALASYWTAPPALEAAGKAMFGFAKASGKLPLRR